MKSAITWIIGLVVIGGGAGLMLKSSHDAARERAYAEGLATIKRNFVADTAPLHFLEDERYRKEIGAHLSKYFKGLSKLAKEYPEHYDVERQRKFGEEQMDKGHMTEAQKLARDERIDITLDVFQRMTDGQYRPLYTKSDKGFRFDIYDISPAKVAGEHKVKVSFLHWGPFSQDHRPGSNSPIRYKSIIGNITAEQAKGKPAEVPQIVGEAQPPSLQIGPERWVAEFPPGIEVGYYDLPQFPQVAKSIQMEFLFGVRTIGGSELLSNIAFAPFEIPDAWKVPEGQAWEAQERFASDEELQAAGAKPTQD